MNSDRIFWQKQENGSFTQVHIEKNVVGRCISTKAVGSDRREDITHLYKHPEGKKIFLKKIITHKHTPSPVIFPLEKIFLVTLFHFSSLGSKAERVAVETASRYGSKPNIYPASVADDVTLQVAIEGEGSWVGEDAWLSFTVNNSSSEKRSIELYCQVASMHYTGVLKGTVKKDEIAAKLKSREGARLFVAYYNTHSYVTV